MTDSDLNLNSNERLEPSDNEFANGSSNYPPQFKLQISHDKMSAVLVVLPGDYSEQLTYETVLSYLEENHIIYGIEHEEIKRYCDENKFDAPLTVANGLPPINGRDAHIMEFFRRGYDLTPKEVSGGRVDFYNLDFVQNVEKGRILSKKIFATQGKDGSNVYGETIAAKPGIDKSFLSGQNTTVSEDGSALLAAIDGCLDIKPNMISISDVVTIRGDVDKTCGNIDALGSVVISGDVREGFRVKAKGDITIRGMVEGAVVDAGGSISIASGMNGMNKGRIVAGNNINCKFIENAQVTCGGSLIADVLINSMVKVKESIILKGSKSCIKGGMYQAGTMIYAKEAGNQNSTPTILSIVSEELNALLIEEFNEEQNKSEQSKARLNDIEFELKKIDDLSKLLSKNPDIAKTDDVLKTVKEKKAALLAEKDEIVKKSNEKKSDAKHLTDFKVVITGTAFPGTRVNISHETVTLKQEITYTKFYLSMGGLQTSALNPGDRL